MIKNVLTSIGGIGLYGMISVCLFFLVFTVAFIHACLLKKTFLNSMSALPLDDGARPVAVRKEKDSTPSARPTALKGSSNHE